MPGDIGRRYAAVSGDRNPIHLHALTAQAFGFPSAIAHGMWLKARTLASLEGRLPDAYTADVAFKLPVLLPSTVSIAAGRRRRCLDPRRPRREVGQAAPGRDDHAAWPLYGGDGDGRGDG